MSGTVFSRGENPLRADKLNQAFSERVSRGGDTMSGPLVLQRDPQDTFEAATKQYVDRIASGGFGIYLPLTGGDLGGPLQVPSGTMGQPSIGFGAKDGTGISRSGAALLLGVTNQPSLGLFPNGGQFYGPLNMLNFRINQVADPTAATDGANKRYVDSMAAGAAGVSSFNTRTGAVTLSSGDVTTALTFTPYDAANPAGYQTAAQVAATVPAASTTLPLVEGTAAVGVSTKYAREDHVHPAGVVAVAAVAPTVGNGVLWFDTNTARLFVGYNDGTSSQWISVA